MGKPKFRDDAAWGPARAGSWTTGPPSPGTCRGVYMKPRFEKELGGMHPRFDPPEWASYGNLQLKVQALRGRTIILDVKPSDTIKMVKAQIRDREGMTVADQKLILAGRALQDFNCVSDYHIRHGSLLILASNDGVKERGKPWHDRMNAGQQRSRPFKESSDTIDRMRCIEAAKTMAKYGWMCKTE